MGHKAIVATCALRQAALDFDGNLQRIIQSIREARSQGATFRVGPELEITPVVHRNVRYNCRVIIFNGRILLIRPKLVLADSGNYHESRWFTEWGRRRGVEQYHLPRIIRQVTSQETVPIGEAVIVTMDTCIGFEICEELFVANSPHIEMALDGVEIFSNGSASHHEVGKLRRRIELILGAAAKVGGIYLYANALGCDGDRLFYDGSPLIAKNADIVAIGEQFCLQDVLVVTAVVDLESVRSYRGLMQSMAGQANSARAFPRIVVDFVLSSPNLHVASSPLQPSFLTPEEEIARGPALWLFDYLRRSGAKGFFLPLSGGLDSCSAALIVFSLAKILADACPDHSDIRQFLMEQYNLKDFSLPTICNALLVTCYISTKNSSPESRQRAKSLSETIGACHLSFGVDGAVDTIMSTVQPILSLMPRFQGAGGTLDEHLALQNLQARLRMVTGYFVAQLVPAALARPGPLLVLSTANASECLRGYFTKYDNSSGDLNPIGSLDKSDLRAFVAHMGIANPSLKAVLMGILEAIPSAELTPPEHGPQTDETEMGMTYDELVMMGRLRNVERYGPYSMYTHMREMRLKEPATNTSQLVKRFFHQYALNRHKASTLPPAYHARSTNPDDNRFDLRPLLYANRWSWQFRCIDRESNAEHEKS